MPTVRQLFCRPCFGPLKAGATHQAVVIRHITGPGEIEIPAQGAVLVGRGQRQNLFVLCGRLIGFVALEL